MQAPNQPPNETHAFVPLHLAHNVKQLQYIRPCFAALAGSVAGILGLRNWSGFLFFALAWAVVSILIITVQCRLHPSHYFVHGWRDVAVDGALPSLLSYILFHTFLNGLVHLYQ